MDWQATASTFLSTYFDELSVTESGASVSYWKAANSGAKADYEAAAAAGLVLKKMHSDAKRLENIDELLQRRRQLDASTARSLELAALAFRGNQLPAALLERMVALSSEIEQEFATFRGELDGERRSNNELLEALADETDSARRQEIWETLKQVGDAVAGRLVELAVVRNEAARSLGFDTYWQMEIRLEEHDPEHLLALFAELEQVTEAPFARMKQELDGELARRFSIEPIEIMPWHYDNPFFQSAPPSAAVDLDEFFCHMKRQDIVDLATRFYRDIGLPIDDILSRSDLYEREGKDQHAFCIDIDRQGDVRTLLNIQPKAEWMNTMLHEQGHAVNYKFLDYELPYNQRAAAHTFTTEAVAMLFGALAENPTWLVDYTGADPDRVGELEAAILEQRRREQLVFARWTMVMLHFEKDLYERPDQDLNALWWNYVERFQGLKRPAGRDAADWASKPHFTIAPVYYHNYMLGELFAAQLRATLAAMANHQGPTSSLRFTGQDRFGDFFINRLFRPGASTPWPDFVRNSTGQELSAEFFAAEVGHPES